MSNCPAMTRTERFRADFPPSEHSSCRAVGEVSLQGKGYGWLNDVPIPQLSGLWKGKGMEWWQDWKDSSARMLDEMQGLYSMPLKVRTMLGRAEDSEFGFW